MSLRLESPQGQVVDKDLTALPVWFSWFIRMGDVMVALTTSGTTVQRPTKLLWKGRPYFDTTLGKPIWVKSTSPTVWVDGVGTVS